MSVNPIQLWQDLRRRNVFKVAAIYAASASIVIQVADVLIDRIPAISEPDRFMTWLIATVIAGFPVTLVLAWLFEIGPDGIVRTKPGSATGAGAIVISRRIGDSDPNSAEHSLEYLSARDFQLS